MRYKIIWIATARKISTGISRATFPLERALQLVRALNANAENRRRGVRHRVIATEDE